MVPVVGPMRIAWSVDWFMTWFKRRSGLDRGPFVINGSFTYPTMVLENSNDDTADLTLDVLLSVILPPAAVYRTRGISDSFWISMALSLLVVPGTD